jgi:hypothetical protein
MKSSIFKKGGNALVGMIGGYVPLKLISQLNMISIILNKPKSELLRGMIANFVAMSNKNHVANELARLILSKWNSPRAKKSTFDKYLLSVGKDLEDRGVLPEDVQLISMEVKKIYAEDKRT